MGQGKLSRQLVETMVRRFGITHYRPGQERTIKALCRGRDVLCIMPTGSGKSLCFQLPGVAMGWVTVVVSPLLALMQDQVRHLQERGISAIMLHGSMGQEAYQQALWQIKRRAWSFVYVSPERLEIASFQEAIKVAQPEMLVVDEAHCVVTWGIDFRLSYQEIGTFVESLPKRPVVCAVTATANPAMCREIIRSLHLRHPVRTSLPLQRENLVYEVDVVWTPKRRLYEILQAEGDHKGLIYCGSRAKTEQTARMLQEAGIAAEAFHAGMSAERRKELQAMLRAGHIRVLCATVAFGMGIDLSDLRFVVHLSLPHRISDYLQETGRVGRNGADAHCYLLITPQNALAAHRSQIAALRRNPDAAGAAMSVAQEIQLAEVQAMLTTALQSRCFPRAMARSMGQWQRACGKCSACRSKERWRGWEKPLKVAGCGETDVILWWLLRIRRKVAKEQLRHPLEICDDEDLRLSAARKTITAQEIKNPQWRAEFQRFFDILRGASKEDTFGPAPAGDIQEEQSP